LLFLPGKKSYWKSLKFLSISVSHVQPSCSREGFLFRSLRENTFQQTVKPMLFRPPCDNIFAVTILSQPKKIKIMKKFNLLTVATTVLITVITLAVSCKKSKPEDDGGNGGPGAIVGNPGNPRFNLQFNNAQNADLDLHVITPSGSEIYYANPSANGGNLDVDCLCGTCPNGPNENIYWQPGTAPRGTYKVYVEHYGGCGTGNSASTYTLRIMNQNQVIQTYTGTLTDGQQSQRISFTY
jgi:hypothetical protein